MKEIIINSNEAGQRLDKLLGKYLNQAPKSFVYKMLRKKNITLNKKKADGKETLSVGDEVQFFFSDETFEKFRGGAATKISKTDLNDRNVNGKNRPNFYAEAKQDYFWQYEAAYKKLKGIEIIYETVPYSNLQSYHP